MVVIADRRADLDALEPLQRVMADDGPRHPAIGDAQAVVGPVGEGGAGELYLPSIRRCIE